MNDLVFLIPQFAAAFLFAYVAFNLKTEDTKNVVLQMLFFILMFGFLLSGFATQIELANIQNGTDSSYSSIVPVVAMTYGSVVFVTIAVIAFILLFLLYGYFVSANEMAVKPKWNRVKHDYD